MMPVLTHAPTMPLTSAGMIAELISLDPGGVGTDGLVEVYTQDATAKGTTNDSYQLKYIRYIHAVFPVMVPTVALQSSTTAKIGLGCIFSNDGVYSSTNYIGGGYEDVFNLNTVVLMVIGLPQRMTL